MQWSRYIFHLLFLVLLNASRPASGQVLDTIYYNAYWQIVGSDSAKHFRVAEIDTVNLWFTGRFRDYYTDSTLLMEGQYSKSGLKNGPFVIYYPSGQVYCKGFFDNDLMAGTWEYFTQNGKIKEKVQFTGADFTILESYDNEGNSMVQYGNGKWLKSFVGSNGNRLEASGRYYNSKREGNWRIKDQQGETIIIERYSNDYFIDGFTYYPEAQYYDETKFTSELFYPGSLRAMESFQVWEARRKDYPYITWLPTGNDSTLVQQETVEKPDQAAHYPLGLEAFYRRVAEILIYPPLAQVKNIQGKVYVEFIVGSDGDLYDARILRGIGGGCDQQAIIAVLGAGRWFPALKNGLPVDQKMVIPVTFRLAP